MRSLRSLLLVCNLELLVATSQVGGLPSGASAPIFLDTDLLTPENRNLFFDIRIEGPPRALAASKTVSITASGEVTSISLGRLDLYVVPTDYEGHGKPDSRPLGSFFLADMLGQTAWVDAAIAGTSYSDDPLSLGEDSTLLLRLEGDVAFDIGEATLSISSTQGFLTVSPRE